VLIEAHDEWQVSDRRYLSEASMTQLTPPTPTALDSRRDRHHTEPEEVIDTPDINTAWSATMQSSTRPSYTTEWDATDRLALVEISRHMRPV